MNTVELYTVGFVASASRSCFVNRSPLAGEKGGCSDKDQGGMIQETRGSVSLATSAWNAETRLFTKATPLSWRGFPGGAFRYWANQLRALRGKKSLNC